MKGFYMRIDWGEEKDWPSGRTSLRISHATLKIHLVKYKKKTYHNPVWIIFRDVRDVRSFTATQSFLFFSSIAFCLIS